MPDRDILLIYRNENGHERLRRQHATDTGETVVDRGPTLEEIIEYLDSECEAANQHSMIGCHAVVAKAMLDASNDLYQDGCEIDKEIVRRAMLDIAQRGGLVDAVEKDRRRRPAKLAEHGG